MSACRIRWWVLLFLTSMVLRAEALEPDSEGPMVTVIEENDTLVRTDRNYTQGLKISFLLPDDVLYKWLERIWLAIPALGYNVTHEKAGFAIGQNIYTPADTSATELLTYDRPYAGYLYGTIILHKRGIMADRFPTLESLELQLGVIGPESLAGQAQTWIHELRGLSTPEGWDNQLGTEPAVAVRYARVARLPAPSRLGEYVDLLPELGFSLGNVETSFRGGALLRLGYHMPQDFGALTISSLRSGGAGWSQNKAQRAWGFYGFIGVEGWIAGYTAFLDGNLFRESHSVQREVFTGEWKVGGALVLRRLEVGICYVRRAPEFSTQTEDHGYASLFMHLAF